MRSSSAWAFAPNADSDPGRSRQKNEVGIMACRPAVSRLGIVSEHENVVSVES